MNHSSHLTQYLSSLSLRKPRNIPAPREPSKLTFSFVAAAAFCTMRLKGVWMTTGQAAGIAASMAAKAGIDVQNVNVVALQDKLRAQHQVVDFIPGQSEKCEHLNGPPEF